MVETQINEPIIQNSVNYPKLLRKRYHRTLGTSVINSTLSPLFLLTHPQVIWRIYDLIINYVMQLKRLIKEKIIKLNICLKVKTFVPKVLQSFFFIRWQKLWGLLLFFIGWFVNLKVQTFQPLFEICREGYFCVLMFINLSVIVLSLYILACISYFAILKIYF